MDSKKKSKQIPITMQKAFEEILKDSLDKIMYDTEYDIFNDAEKSALMAILANKFKTYSAYYQSRYERQIERQTQNTIQNESNTNN